MNTSGGALDLSPVKNLTVQARLRILLVSGISRPQGLEDLGVDWVYPKSNFLRRVVTQSWGVQGMRIFVSYNGFEAEAYSRAEACHPIRDPFRITHISHPTKGIETSMDVVQRLRSVDSRYHLWVFGGTDLWGQAKSALPFGPGISAFGTIGQDELALQLMRCSYSLCLHSIPEGFGNAIIESQRAGCVVVASDVGAQPELIRDGRDGLVVCGDHRDDAVRAQAAEAILDVDGRTEAGESIRAHAIRAPLDTLTVARAWLDHWSIAVGAPPLAHRRRGSPCRECGGESVRLVDGVHCMDCGCFSRVWQAED
jgi:glycosyltransferase involved in cell wall biosynthesis